MTLPRMAYFMHVHWNWIKQRPHFLYEELTKYFHIDLFYIGRVFDKKNLAIQNSRKTYTESSIRQITKIPYSSRYKLLCCIESMLNRNKIMGEYQYIWITSPLILQFVPRRFLDNKMIIYDCMDNFLEFSSIKRNAEKYFKLECELLQYSKFVFASSNTLKNELMRNYGAKLRVEPICINNGIDKSMLRDLRATTNIKEKGHLNLLYIGTISDWFDVDLIYLILNKFEDVNITLVGPLEIPLVNHPRLNMIGPVIHENLQRYADSADAFIMPFLLNDLILSVDPVKIYEYLIFSKPIISIDYEEMHKFKPFVQLYRSHDEALRLIERLKTEQLEDCLSKEDVASFLSNNTWEKRASQINNILIR